MEEDSSFKLDPPPHCEEVCSYTEENEEYKSSEACSCPAPGSRLSDHVYRDVSDLNVHQACMQSDTPLLGRCDSPTRESPSSRGEMRSPPPTPAHTPLLGHNRHEVYPGDISSMLSTPIPKIGDEVPPSPPPDYEVVAKQDNMALLASNTQLHPAWRDTSGDPCGPLSMPSSTIPAPSPASVRSGFLPFSMKHTYSLSNMDTKSDCGSMNMNICRICHMPEDEDQQILISPCRCAGSLQYIHNTCLMRWLAITTKKSRKPPKCELCHFPYNRHKKFKFHHWRWPRVSKQDKILHIIFLINLLLMVACAIATVMCFLYDKGRISKFPRHKVDLTEEEIVTLSCGVLFFVSFFIAMSVQIKAKHTVYQLFVKFIMQNMEWEIDEYDKEKDAMFKEKSKSFNPLKLLHIV